jgi:hypothetical protein
MHTTSQSVCQHFVSSGLIYISKTEFIYIGCSSRTGTFNFTGIKRDASVALLHAVVSGKCVLLQIGGQSRDHKSRWQTTVLVRAWNSVWSRSFL